MGPGTKVIISGEYREGIIQSWNESYKMWNVLVTLGPDKGKVFAWWEDHLSKIG